MSWLEIGGCRSFTYNWCMAPNQLLQEPSSPARKLYKEIHINRFTYMVWYGSDFFLWFRLGLLTFYLSGTLLQTKALKFQPSTKCRWSRNHHPCLVPVGLSVKPKTPQTATLYKNAGSLDIITPTSSPVQNTMSQPANPPKNLPMILRCLGVFMVGVRVKKTLGWIPPSSIQQLILVLGFDISVSSSNPLLYLPITYIIRLCIFSHVSALDPIVLF